MMAWWLQGAILMLLTMSSHSQSNILRPECRIEVDKCEPLSTRTCLGTELSYSMSSQILAADSDNETQVIEKLGLWSGIRNVPKCWEVIQPFLCSVYMPRCVQEGNASFVNLPGVELCEQTRKPCKVVETYSGWPAFLQCNNTFPPGCSQFNPVMTLQFNTTSTCEKPLVKTDDKRSWYRDVDGCGIQCQNPLFTDKEHEEVHIFIAVFGSICMACTLFAVLSFIIDWKNSNRYPALILFFINACFFIGSIGWMAQFIPGARKDIVCRSDGTMRTAEPQLGAGETAACTVVFILVYYFMIAGVTWFVILSYSWHLTFKALDYPRDAIEGKRGHFHLVAWSCPLVLTIVCLALTQIDGDSVSGICFVGYLNHTYRGFFVLLPVGIVMVIGAGFLIAGLVTLIKMNMTTPGLISDKASAKIRETIIRLGIFATFAVLFVMVTFFVHAYIFTNEPLWKKSFEEYIICEANVTVALAHGSPQKQCKMESRPNLVAMEIHIFAYFGAGIVMSSWVWNKATLLTWRRFLRKKFLNKEDDKPEVHLHKHEIIAQAYTKRGEMNDGRISLSFYSTHDDPVGMKFDLNSVSSFEMSSAWAAAIPRMIMRRGGMSAPNARRYSDSDVQSIQSTSFGISGIMVESHSPRRNSMQSHNSHSLSHSEQDDSLRKKKKKRRHRHRGSNRIAPVTTTTATQPPNNTIDQISLKAGSIDAGSSLVPSSQCSRCTSRVSSSIDHPQAEHVDDTNHVVTVDIHDIDSDVEKAERKPQEIPKPIDSDSMNSEDSVFTAMPDAEPQEIESEEEAKPSKSRSPDDNIPSQNSAFQKYSREKTPERVVTPPPEQHYLNSSQPVPLLMTPTSYMASGAGYYLPEYVSPQPRYPMPMPGMYHQPPEMYHGMPFMSPYMNQYPMTFMPHDFFLPPPGYPLPPPAYYPHPSMSPPYPYPMTPPFPMYSPYEPPVVQLPQKVEPVRYNRQTKQPAQTHQPTEVDFPKRSKHFRENSVKCTSAFDNPAFEPPSPTVKDKAQVLRALDGNHHAILKPSRGSPKFSSSSTWHLDHVELESVSDQSV